jgi:hypothetical protein
MSNNNLQNEINALKLLVDRMQQALTASNLELEAALMEKAEIERLRADADRYRWLLEESAKKHYFYSNDSCWMVSRQQGGIGYNFFGDKITAAIDAERSAK